MRGGAGGGKGTDWRILLKYKLRVYFFVCEGVGVSILFSALSPVPGTQLSTF